MVWGLGSGVGIRRGVVALHKDVEGEAGGVEVAGERAAGGEGGEVQLHEVKAGGGGLGEDGLTHVLYGGEVADGHDDVGPACRQHLY